MSSPKGHSVPKPEGAHHVRRYRYHPGREPDRRPGTAFHPVRGARRRLHRRLHAPDLRPGQLLHCRPAEGAGAGPAAGHPRRSPPPAPPRARRGSGPSHPVTRPGSPGTPRPCRGHRPAPGADRPPGSGPPPAACFPACRPPRCPGAARQHNRTSQSCNTVAPAGIGPLIAGAGAAEEGGPPAPIATPGPGAPVALPPSVVGWIEIAASYALLNSASARWRILHPMTDDYPLGYLGNPGWTDMSDYLVHMTGHGVVGRANLNSILTSGEIRPGMRTGAARNLVEVPNQETTSFSEIPMGHLDRLVARKGVYGVGFSKQALLAKGAAPVWYLPLGTPVASHFSELVRHAMIGGIDPADSIWKCTPFVDYPGVYSTARYEFEWEREWRMPGLLSFDLR